MWGSDIPLCLKGRHVQFGALNPQRVTGDWPVAAGSAPGKGKCPILAAKTPCPYFPDPRCRHAWPGRLIGHMMSYPATTQASWHTLGLRRCIGATEWQTHAVSSSTLDVRVPWMPVVTQTALKLVSSRTYTVMALAAPDQASKLRQAIAFWSALRLCLSRHSIRPSG